MIKEHDRVILQTDLPAERLIAGDVGVVVHIYEGGAAYEVEFLSLTGQTVTVQTLEKGQVRAVTTSDLLHARVQPDAA